MERNSNHAPKGTCRGRKRAKSRETRPCLVVCFIGLKMLAFGSVEHDSGAQFVGVDPVANGAEIHDLEDMLACVYAKAMFKILPTYFDICQVVPLHRGNTASLVKTHLPNPAEVGEKVLDALSGADVPQLQGSITAAYDLPPVMLKAGNGTTVRRQCRLATSSRRIPDTKRRIGCRRDEPLIS